MALLLISSTISTLLHVHLLLLLLVSNPTTNKAKKHHDHDQLGPLTNITKSLSFQHFNPSTNPTLPHDIKLLGNAIFSNSSIQIPAPNSPSIQTTTSIDYFRYQAGRALFSSPVRLLDPLTQSPASFHTTFSFQFTPTSTSISKEDSGGSGLTFIIVPDELTIGRPGPWLAMMNDACDDDYKIIAVEFDTRCNVEFGDPNDNHVGINLGSVISSITANASDVGVYLKDGSVHRAWITYDGITKLLDIRLGPNSQVLPKKPVFSSEIDLSPYLNEYMFIGFSASTGNHTQIHSILDWNFSSTSQAVLRIPSTKTCEKKILAEAAHRKPPSGFLIFVSVVVLILVVLLNFYCSSKRQSQKSTVVILPEKNQRPRPPNKPWRFTMSEVSVATRCFSEAEVLSSDSRGVRYRGVLHNGCHVEVMRFSTRFLNSSGVDRRRLKKEIVAISRVRHPNLVSVRGWCCDNRENIVVYDYLPNRSLDRWLFGNGVLPWTRRFKVIKDIAESLSFLHSKKLAHKNVKTTSVFLDVTFRAVLGDFGFVNLPSDSTRAESVVGQAADVFAFGIVALEIVAGKRNSGFDLGVKEQMGLMESAWSMHDSGELLKVVDRRIGPVFNSDQAVCILETGLLCTVNDSKHRPSMEEVVGFINMERPIPMLPVMNRPVALFAYNNSAPSSPYLPNNLCNFVLFA